MATATISASKTVSADRDDLWAVLADFPNIADWSAGVKRSYATSSSDTGVGAQRHCDLSPAGALEETIQEFVPGERMVISIDKASVVPIKSSLTTFELRDAEDGSGGTEVSVTAQTQPKGGPLSPIIARRMAKGLTKGLAGLIDELDTAARARAVG